MVRGIVAVLSLAALLLPLSPATEAFTQEQRALRGVALVIGQSKYRHLAPLPNPANDADAIETLLSDLGFDSIRRTDRDAETLSRDLERFAEDAQEADVAVLYYSGHGIEAGGENFLVPVDADLSALDAAATRLVPVSALIEKLKATVPVAIVMLDACRDNPFPEGALLRPGPGDAASPVGVSGLVATRSVEALDEQSAPAEPATGRENVGAVIAFAAEPGKVALDGDAGGNSPYAAAVLRHLDAMAGEEFGMVMRMVAEEVYLKTAGAQRPWINESLRRQLYFGEKPSALSGDEGELLRERRGLLVTIATLPDPERRRGQLERIAREGGVPLDAVYGMLRALGADAPEDPAELGNVLRAEAERFATFLAERQTINSPDAEIVRLSALADRAEQEGLLLTADTLRERAKARYLETEMTLEQQEAALRRRFIEGAETFARSAETKVLSFSHLAAAQDFAEAFRRVEGRDSQLAWRYKNAEMVALILHGDYKGDNAALERAIEAGGQALRIAGDSGLGDDWATTQNDLGNALMYLGERESGSERLKEAVEAYRAVLKVNSRERVPLQWAGTQTNLGNALRILGERESSPVTLEEAVVAFRASLEERTRDRMPLDWAMTQNNLGAALLILGNRESGVARLEEAIDVFRAALEERTHERVPLQWAETQINLGSALFSLGARRNDAAQMEAAVEAFHAALKVRTRERTPLDWAMTQNNLGSALMFLGGRDGGTARMEAAVDAFRLALEEHTRERVPLEWAMTQNNLGLALRNLGARDSGVARLEEAVGAFRAALEERTRERAPLQWAETYSHLGTALWNLGERQSGTARLEEAVGAFRAALEERTRERAPLQWAATQTDLGSALQALGKRETGTARLQESVDAFDAALLEFSQESLPIEWATAQNNLGGALVEIGWRSRSKADIDEGRQAIAAAWAVFREAGHTQHDDYFRQRIAYADKMFAAVK